MVNGAGAAAGGAVGTALGHSAVRGALAGVAVNPVLASAAGGAVAAAGAIKAGKAIKKAIDTEKKAREHAASKYNETSLKVKDAKGNEKELSSNYSYASRRQDRRATNIGSKINHREAISNAKNEMKAAAREAARTGDVTEYEKKKNEYKSEKDKLKSEIKKNNQNYRDMAKIARLSAKADIKKKEAASRTPITEMFSDIDLMYILENEGYEGTLDNLILLKEGLESGTYEIFFECNYSDYDLYQLLECNGYETTNTNLNILREGIISGEYFITD